MKKQIVFLFALLLASTSLLAQSKNTKAVVMYFKADLACCKARACASIENDIKAIVEENFQNGNVVFSSIRISDPENAAMVEQYKAKSQTVMIVVSKKKKVSSVEASELVSKYVRDRDKEAFEKEFVQLINANMK
jgi:hypothetical protein